MLIFQLYCWCHSCWFSGEPYLLIGWHEYDGKIDSLNEYVDKINSKNEYGGKIDSMNEYSGEINLKLTYLSLSQLGWITWLNKMFYNIGYFDDDDDDDFVVIILLWEMHLFNAISAIFKSALFASAAAKIEQNWSPPRDTKGKYIFIIVTS